MRMKAGIRFDPEVLDCMVIVLTWDNTADHGKPTEW